MLERINQWLLRVFSHQDVNQLIVLALLITASIWIFGGELAPVLVGILIAYVLESGVKKIMQITPLSRPAAVGIVVVGSLLGAIVSVYFLPQFLLQLRELGDRLPEAAIAIEAAIGKINTFLPADITLDKAIVLEKTQDIANALGQYLFSNTLAFAGNLLSLIIYAILLPLLVFFLLKDKERLFAYLSRFIKPTPVLKELWLEMDTQFGSYLRGKCVEALIIGLCSWFVFLLFSLKYAFALAVMVGLSVFVPFIGAVVVTFPVILFAYLQYGWSGDFAWVIGLYFLIQVLDGQLLVPLLFSEAVKIHVVALFVAIIFFGNLWGVLGVFFAIPLASLIKSVINVLEKHTHPPVS